MGQIIGIVILVFLSPWILGEIIWILNDVFDIQVIGDPRPKKDRSERREKEREQAEVKERLAAYRARRNEALVAEWRATWAGRLHTRLSKVIKKSQWWDV